MRISAIIVLAGLAGLASTPPAAAADALFYGIIKLRQFTQAPGGNPVSPASNAYSFQAFVVASNNFAVTNATVSFNRSSTPVVKTLALETNGLALRFEERFDTSQALEAAYPSGTAFSPVTFANNMYTLNDGVRRGNLTFFITIISIQEPVTPVVSNLVAAQTIDSTLDFQLRWNTLGTDLTLLQFLVLDGASNTVFATPLPLQPGSLNGYSNAVVIPAHTLPAGTNFVAHLTVASPGLPNTNGYVGAIGLAAKARDLEFPLVTRPLPPTVLFVEPPVAGRFQLRLIGDTDRVYRIDATGDFLTWTNLLTTNSASGDFFFTDPTTPSLMPRYYRATVGQ